jgi:DNA gyrase subunit A
VHTTALAHLLLFSNRGKVYRLRAHEVPVKERTARGTPVVNLISLEPEERIQAIVETREFDPDRYLLFATKQGTVKKTPFSEYDKSRREGFIAINLQDGDELVRVLATSGADDVFIASKNGMTIRFSEQDVRPMGRSAGGVRGMKLRDGDEVVSCDVAAEDSDLLLVTDAGYGKRTKLDHFNVQGRGGQGVRGIKLTQRRGYVVGALMARLDDELLLASTAGVVIRIAVRDIAAQGRDATGVRVMNLDEGASVAAVAPLATAEEE